MHDDLFPYCGLSAERASRKAAELVERCAAGRMGWMALAGELRKLEYVARTAPVLAEQERRHVS